ATAPGCTKTSTVFGLKSHGMPSARLATNTTLILRDSSGLASTTSYFSPLYLPLRPNTSQKVLYNGTITTNTNANMPTTTTASLVTVLAILLSAMSAPKNWARRLRGRRAVYLNDAPP